MLGVLVAMTAHAGPDAEVARGWYLWRTGQDEAAAELAEQIVDEHPEHLGGHRLHVAMEVVVGNGASVEARYREWWGLDPQDPARRIALAFAVAQRHAERGPWCDEVEALLAAVPVTIPPAPDEVRPSKKRPFTPEHYWATVADRVREQRCEGTTDHADAELRRLAKEGGLGWADGVVARLDAAYIKEDLPPDLERLWAEHPERLDAASMLWREGVAGPSKGKARHVATRALSDALEGDDPVAVHAAVAAYRGMDKDSKIEDAVARLAALDPTADPDLVRSLDDVEDPPVYSAIDACRKSPTAGDILACLDGVADVGETGAVAAYWHAQRRAAFEVGNRLDEAFDAARAAWQADPSHRFNARTFARLAVGREALAPEDATLAVDAMQVVLAGRVPEQGEVPEGQRKRLAQDLELGSLALLAADRPGEALDGQLLAAELDPRSRRQLILGQLLAAAGQEDDAVLRLAHGLAHEQDDTALITAGRALLSELDQGWHPRGMPGMIEEAARTPDQDAPRHPLLGKPFPLPDLLPPPVVGEEEEEPEPVAASVVVLWAGWHEGDVAALQRLAGIAGHYADRGVLATALSVGFEEEPIPEDIALDGAFAGSAAMRELRIVGLPALFVVAGDGTIAAARAPWHHAGMDLEDALDDVLPEEEEE